MSERKDSALECAQFVKDEVPTADGATWMKQSRKCWAETGHKAVRNNGPSDARYTSCGLTASESESAETEEVFQVLTSPPPAPVVKKEAVTLKQVDEKPAVVYRVKCASVSGDGIGGSEAYLKTTNSMQECADYVYKNHLDANGATWGTTNKKCYKEVGMTSHKKSTSYVTCFLAGTLKKKGNGGCSCKGEKYCRTGYKQWKDLTLLQCKDKAIEIGAKALEYGSKYGCMTHMSVATGGNTYPGVTCYDVVLPPKPTATLEKKGNGGCSCKGEVYCRTGYKQYPEMASVEECKDEAFAIGAKAVEFSTKDGCMTHMSEATGSNNYPGVTCYDVVVTYSPVESSGAFASSPGPTNRTVIVQGFALLGLGALLYGAGKHYLGK